MISITWLRINYRRFFSPFGTTKKRRPSCSGLRCQFYCINQGLKLLFRRNVVLLNSSKGFFSYPLLNNQPMAPGEIDSDSGIGSMHDSSKDATPEKKRGCSPCTPQFDDDEEDETLAERLWGLTEMFPESVRDATFSVYCGSKAGIKGLYSLTRTTMWIIFSSSAILLAPVLFEVERAQIEEVQRSQQKQVLLGPNTAGGMPPYR